MQEQLKMADMKLQSILQSLGKINFAIDLHTRLQNTEKVVQLRGTKHQIENALADRHRRVAVLKSFLSSQVVCTQSIDDYIPARALYSEYLLQHGHDGMSFHDFIQTTCEIYKPSLGAFYKNIGGKNIKVLAGCKPGEAS